MKRIKLFKSWLDLNSLELNETSAVDHELLDLVKRWVLGNEDYYGFLPEDGERLVKIIEKNPWIREGSLSHLAKSGSTHLWRGLHEEWEEEYEDQLGGSLFSSYTTSKEVAKSFGDGDLLSVPVSSAKQDVLLSVEWCAIQLGVEPFSEEELKKFKHVDDLIYAGGDPDERWFRYMAYQQKEYLVLNKERTETQILPRR